MFDLAKLVASQEPARAEHLYRTAAELGDVRAMYNLGNGLMEQGDLDEARRWWVRAAEEGLGAAMHNLGVSFWERTPMSLAGGGSAALRLAMWTR